jgi:16S rRNA (guanine1516-N2)-methyltransferase
MYPSRTKSALNKNTMRTLRKIVGDDLDSTELLEAALKAAGKRTVVKRPRLAPQIPGPKPDIIYQGKSSRFDVYLKHLLGKF